jgi:hypothetical protein
MPGFAAMGHGAVVHNRVKNAKNATTDPKIDPKIQERRTPAEKDGRFVFKRTLSNLEEDLKLDPVDLSKAKDAVDQNSHAPMVQGMLKKRAATLAGFGPAIWHDRYVILDPCEGVLQYSEPSKIDGYDILGGHAQPTHNPKHAFALKNIIQVESNHRHHIFQVVFGKPERRREVQKVLQLQAETDLDFEKWMQALQPYGMREGPKTPTAKSAKETPAAKRAKSTLKKQKSTASSMASSKRSA